MADSLSIKDSFSERQLYASRSMSLGLLVLVMFFLLIARSIQLQVVEYAAYRTRSDENRIQVEPKAPSRGLILRNSIATGFNPGIFPVKMRDKAWVKRLVMGQIILELGTLGHILVTVIF